MKSILHGLIPYVIICAIVYGCYWVGKTISYKLMYEDMVKETIESMVKKEGLR